MRTNILIAVLSAFCLIMFGYIGNCIYDNNQAEVYCLEAYDFKNDDITITEKMVEEVAEKYDPIELEKKEGNGNGYIDGDDNEGTKINTIYSEKIMKESLALALGKDVYDKEVEEYWEAHKEEIRNYELPFKYPNGDQATFETVVIDGYLCGIPEHSDDYDPSKKSH